MSILAFPPLYTAPSAAIFSLVPNTASFTSPLNRSVQTVDLPGARYSCSIEWRGLSNNDVRLIRAFLAQLRGAAGRFYLWDVSHEKPAGSCQGAGAVNGALQSGASIITDGWTPGQANLLLPGDYIGIGSELKLITVLASSDISGNATLTFEPPLRSAPLDNAPIVVYRPTCIMRLADDEQDKIQVEPPLKPGFTLNAVETF